MPKPVHAAARPPVASGILAPASDGPVPAGVPPGCPNCNGDARAMASKKKSSNRDRSAGVSTAVRLAGWILAALFLVAGISKVIDPWTFIASLGAYGVPASLRVPIAILLPAGEVLLGVLFLAGWHLRKAGAIAAALMAVFIVAVGFGWWNGTLEECGCFGPFLERSPRDAILLDVVFLGLAVWIWYGSASAKKVALKTGQVGALAGIGIAAFAVSSVMYMAAPTAIDAATEVSGDRDARAVDLSQGEHLLYLFHYECPHCAEMSPRVVTYIDDPTLPPLLAVTFDTPEAELERYRETHGLTVPVQVLEPRAFVRITGEGAVPQLVYVREGRIERTWLGVLPEREELVRELRRVR